jgi:hypothetical protein
LVTVLKREETVELYKEIITECRLDLSSVSIVYPSNNNTVSKGCQLHITSVLDVCDRERLEDILKKHSLAYREINNRIIIYKSKEADPLLV